MGNSVVRRIISLFRRGIDPEHPMIDKRLAHMETAARYIAMHAAAQRQQQQRGHKG